MATYLTGEVSDLWTIPTRGYFGYANDTYALYNNRTDTTDSATTTYKLGLDVGAITSDSTGLYVYNNASANSYGNVYSLYNDYSGSVVLNNATITETYDIQTTPLANYFTDINLYTGYISGLGIEPVSQEEYRKRMKLSNIKSKMVIKIKSRADLITNVSESERAALETLREMISEFEYRKYLRDGFLLVKGASGDVYQVFRNLSHTKVRRAGKIIEEVCVRINKDVKAPPTDNVIAFKTLIETDETAFKSLGNVYKFKGEQTEQFTLNIVAGNNVIQIAA